MTQPCDKDLARFMTKVKVGPGCWLWSGKPSSEGYGWFYLPGQRMYAHRFSFLAHGGELPSGLVVDHSCHNRLCVKPDHLRAMTQKQNTENHRGAKSNSRSGVRGVHLYPKTGHWYVQVTHHRKSYWGGSYRDLKEAERAAVELRTRLHTFNDIDRSAA